MQQKLLTYKYVQNGIRSHAEFLNNFFFFFFFFFCFFFPSLRNVSVRAPAQQVWQQQQQQQQQQEARSGKRRLVLQRMVFTARTDRHQQVKLTDQICVCAQL